tara:strand:- start:135 stop:605 length:471 start_codon:yes stop_codon:yes gene_type:complete
LPIELCLRILRDTNSICQLAGARKLSHEFKEKLQTNVIYRKHIDDASRYIKLLIGRERGFWPLPAYGISDAFKQFPENIKQDISIARLAYKQCSKYEVKHSLYGLFPKNVKDEMYYDIKEDSINTLRVLAFDMLKMVLLLGLLLWWKERLSSGSIQ